MDILICTCIIFILLITHTIWPKYMYDPGYGKLQVADILKNPPDIELRTGDIVFVKNCTKCKYSDDFMNNGFQYVYRNMFNSFRWYITDQAPYTHVAIVIRLNITGKEIPYICHMDGGMPMYDELRKKYIAGNGAVVSSMRHINVCGGVVHVYRYRGESIKKDMLQWIKSNENTKYPHSMYKLTMSNALKWDKNPEGVMACTDFVENTLNHIGVLGKNHVSGQSTINDIFNIVKKNEVYESVPIILKNKCYNTRHFL